MGALKRRIKSQCLHRTQVQECRNPIQDMSMTFNHLNVKAITMLDPINISEVTGISNDSAAFQALNVLETLLNDILEFNLAALLNISEKIDTLPST